jgi:hypothetical protein
MQEGSNRIPTNPGGPLAMTTCPRCSSPDLVGFTLSPRGEALTFGHCRGCEHRWWRQEEAGPMLPLGEVLGRIGTAA